MINNISNDLSTDLFDHPHILVVDDDTRLRELLRNFLGQAGFRVTTARIAKEAENLMETFIFDLMVLDVMMPNEDGFSFSRRLRARHTTYDVPVLLLTAMGETEDKIRGLEGGVDDYLVKPFEPRELVLRIDAILRRTSRDSDLSKQPSVLVMGDIQFDCIHRVLLRGGTPVKLTSMETTLLEIMAHHKGQTVTRQDLCSLLSTGSERAVDVQVARLRKKIEPDPKNPRFLQTSWGEGYILITQNQ